MSFVVTKVLLRQTYLCCNKTFAATNICCNKHNFVTTKLLLRQAYFCGKKTRSFVTALVTLILQIWRKDMWQLWSTSELLWPVFHSSSLLMTLISICKPLRWCSLHAQQNMSFVVTKVLLRQTYLCCNKTFAATNICCNKHNFVTTKLLLRQAYFCGKKTRKYVFCQDKNILLWQTHFCQTKACLPRQKRFCCARYVFVMTKDMWQK